MVTWGGQDHWLGTDHRKAEAAYVDEIAKWANWQQQLRQVKAARPKRGMSVHDLAERFFETRLAEGGRERLRFYRTHTKRFIASYSTARADCVRPVMLQRLKDAMLASGLAPRTINHDIQAVKTMFQWGMDLEMIPAVNLHGVRKLPLSAIADKSWTPAFVKSFVLGDKDSDPNVTAHLAVNYLCALRPLEVIRIMRGEGKWEQRGVLVIPNKVRRYPRRVLFSAEAFGWLRKCAPQWTRSDSYYHAVLADGRTAGPHRLRHSAATHLNQRGVPREDVDAILGHYPGTVSLTYTPMQWRRLRLSAARLTLRE